MLTVTENQAKELRLIKLINDSPPDDVFVPGNGKSTSFALWLRREQMRLRLRGRQAEIVKRDNGMLSLWVRPVCTCGRSITGADKNVCWQHPDMGYRRRKAIKK